MTKTVTIPNKFLCRPYQIPAWEAMEAGKKRMVLCWHRGAGKDLFALNYLIYKAVQEPGVYLHCFPKYTQAKRAIWKGIHDTHENEPVSYLEHFPEELIESKNASEMSIKLINGSVYHLMGVDGKNAAVARGMNPKFVIMSEYAFMERDAWDTIEPRLSQNNGIAMFVSTPNGQNHFYDLYNYASNAHLDTSNPLNNSYFSSLLTIDDTSIYDKGFIESKRAEGMPEDFIQQEYFCSFTRGAEGSYYGKQIQKARDEDRICKLSISPDIRCDTCWDIGVGDQSAIWIFQRLKNGKINFLDYYENHGEGLEHYLQYLDKFKAKHKIIWGSHYVPHDMMNREFTSGIDRLSSARDMGYEMLIVKRHLVEEGIQNVRATLPHCNFDEGGCKRGITCLDLYRKKFNDILKVYYDTPLHDQYSHGADAFRTGIMGIKTYGDSGKLSAESI